eukprot:m.225530 g.225530  ORF g.225530 m.225530 type:complete len:860 (-) comp33462_c1_seq3:94-2673(-)
MDVARQIFDAAQIGNERLVCELIDKKDFNPDQRDADQNTMMHFAAANGHVTVVKLLLDRMASVDAESMYAWTPLMQASAYGHNAVVNVLLEHGASVHKVNAMGSTATVCAARDGHAPVVQTLIDAGAALDFSLDSPSPLMAASMAGHDSVCDLLLRHDANVNAQLKQTGWTPLMFAAQAGEVDVVQTLMASKADPNQVNILDMTPLDIAVAAKHDKVEKLLSKKTDTMRSTTRQNILSKLDIFEATKSGNYDRTKDILKADPKSVNKKDPDGATCLMFAAMRGHMDIVALLIDNNAAIDEQDSLSGWTALMNAVYYGYNSIARCLIDAGATVSIQARNGCTAFDIASIIGDTEIVRLLATVSMRPPLEDANTNTGMKNIGSDIFGKSFDSSLSFGRERLGTSPLPPRSKSDREHRPPRTPGTFRKLISSRGKRKSTASSNSNQFDRLNSASSRGTSRTSMSIMKKVSSVFSRLLRGRRNSGQHQILKINSVVPVASNDHMPQLTSQTVPPPQAWTESSENMLPAKQVVLAPPWRPNGGLTGSNPTTPNDKLPSTHSRNDPVVLLPRPSVGKMENMAPMSKLPAAVLAPIKPPFIPPPAFELPHIERPKFERPTHIYSGNIQPMNSAGAARSKMRSSFLKPKDALSSHTSAHRKRTNTSANGRARSSHPPLSEEEQTSPSKLQQKKPRVTFAPIPKMAPIIKTTVNHDDSDSSTDDFLPDVEVKPLELKSVVKKAGLEHLNVIFEEQEIDMDAFVTLTEDDMTELGITVPQDRQKLAAAISQLKENPPKTAPYSPLAKRRAMPKTHMKPNFLPPTRPLMIQTKWSPTPSGITHAVARVPLLKPQLSPTPPATQQQSQLTE